MPNPAPRRSLAIALLLAAAVGVVAVMVAPWGDEGGAAEPLPLNPTPLAAASGNREGLRAPEEGQDAAAAREAAVGEAVPLHILCLDAATRQPLAGIRLYAKKEPIEGPTAADGVLEVRGEHTAMLTVWGEGWIPLEVPGRALPEEVLLTAPDGALEVRLSHLLPGCQVIRTHLQPRQRLAYTGGPWEPVLTPRAVDLYRSERLPPGGYDLYFWIRLDTGEERTASRSRVEVRAGETAEVALDLANLPSGESDD